MALPYSVLIAGLGTRIEEFLIPTLVAEHYQVTSCLGLEPLLATLNRSLDLVLLDVPTEDELASLADVRAACPCSLIVVGPARNDRLLIDALEAGADDYVQRPFRTAELLARIRAQLRRRLRGSGTLLVFGPLTVDPHARQATRDGRELELSNEEFALLTVLAARPGSLFPPGVLAEQLWGRRHRDEHARLDRVIAHLRIRIEPDPHTPTILGGTLQGGFWLGGAARERNGEP